MMRAFAIALAVLTLVSCVDASRGGSKMSFPERAECRNKGGEVIVAGMYANEICVLPRADAGKVCHKGSDCLGRCLVDDDVSSAGTCSKNDNPFGCVSYLDDDSKVQTECQD
ncbi:MAG: hypothetical protein CFE33_16265 [Pseudorhodobacter sp. PARRP1]|nr:MAG: hypothetical protein CFE33_16265 [Pseudorhodobacter sp. PARRP1]